MVKSKIFILQYGEPYGEGHFIIGCYTTLEGAEEAQDVYDKANDISESSFGFTYIDKHDLKES